MRQYASVTKPPANPFTACFPKLIVINNLCVTKQHVSRNFYQQRHREQFGTTGTWQPSMSTKNRKKYIKKFPLVHFELLSASGIKKTSSEQKKDLWQVILRYQECVFPRTSITSFSPERYTDPFVTVQNTLHSCRKVCVLLSLGVWS